MSDETCPTCGKADCSEWATVLAYGYDGFVKMPVDWTRSPLREDETIERWRSAYSKMHSDYIAMTSAYTELLETSEQQKDELRRDRDWLRSQLQETSQKLRLLVEEKVATELEATDEPGTR